MAPFFAYYIFCSAESRPYSGNVQLAASDQMDEWNDLSDQRPSKADFDPAKGDLDALSAWEHFGGLSRKAAYKKFCELPGYYQEDFAFMGGVAFIYYFPVIERYIFESRVENGEDVEAMRILAFCIKAQHEAKHVDHLLCARILDLVNHVRGNLAQYGVDFDEQKRIDGAWCELESSLGF
jgi:hypothetical protein